MCSISSHPTFCWAPTSRVQAFKLHSKRFSISYHPLSSAASPTAPFSPSFTRIPFPARPLCRSTMPPSASTSQPSTSSKPQTSVLFVCLGNICRSPSAEAVFRATVERAGVPEKFAIDSCGTGGGSSNWYLQGGFSYHEGDPADSRMTRVAASRGVHLTSLSRPLSPSDFDRFDVILGMDASNIAAIRRAAQHWQKEGRLSEAAGENWGEKVGLMTAYLRDPQFSKRFNEVPDPYYGGEKGFELVLDLLEDACEGLLEAVNAGEAGK